MIGSIQDSNELRAILAKAVTMAQGFVSPHVDDDLRMLRHIKPTFLGRSAYVWLMEDADEQHFATARSWARRVHDEVDPNIVCQACIFEAIYPEADAVAIPEWVFKDLGEEPEHRYFSWKAMIDGVEPPGQGVGSIWYGGGVPDITTPEAFRWYYYRAVSYMKAGYEALHLGQAHQIAGCDRGYRIFAKLCQKIREAAVIHARRKWVILDAHSHGIAVDGQLLFDFVSMPMTSRSLQGRAPQIALVRRGGTLGGLHPGGWQCDETPCLREVDNWLGYSMDPNPAAWVDGHQRAKAGKWGWDDITWFANLDPKGRANFLRYARRWTALQGRDHFFQPALNRSLGQAVITTNNGQTLRRYHANNPGPDAPNGFGDEESIAAILSETEGIADPPPTQPMMTTAGAVVAPVVVVGELQDLLGGIPGEASCPWSTLFQRGDSFFSRTFAAPIAGAFGFHLTCGGTHTHQVRANGSASGAGFFVQLRKAGDLFTMTFDAETNEVTVVDAQTGENLLVSQDALRVEAVPVTQLGQVAF